MLHNLITWHEFYTVRPASRGISMVESELGVELKAQALYDAMLLKGADKLGFYLSQHDFEEKLFHEICD